MLASVCCRVCCRTVKRVWASCRRSLSFSGLGGMGGGATVVSDGTARVRGSSRMLGGGGAGVGAGGAGGPVW